MKQPVLVANLEAVMQIAQPIVSVLWCSCHSADSTLHTAALLHPVQGICIIWYNETFRIAFNQCWLSAAHNSFAPSWPGYLHLMQWVDTVKRFSITILIQCWLNAAHSSFALPWRSYLHHIIRWFVVCHYSTYFILSADSTLHREAWPYADVGM